MTTQEKDKYFGIRSWDNKYFIEPNKLYYDTYGSHFVDTINPYTNGARGMLCMVELLVYQNRITIERFISYVTKWHLETGLVEDLPLYKGLGKYLLQKVLANFPSDYIVVVTPAINVLHIHVPYYRSLGFKIKKGTSEMVSTVERVLEA
jgi:hypothetical protein